jgi:hypothetical protein
LLIREIELEFFFFYILFLLCTYNIATSKQTNKGINNNIEKGKEKKEKQKKNATKIIDEKQIYCDQYRLSKLFDLNIVHGSF